MKRKVLKHVILEGSDKNIIKSTGVVFCAEHGTWLDRGELQEIFSATTKAIAQNKKRAIRDARYAGKIQGIFCGIWSLLLK
jgi:hypothetical protein